MTENCSRGMWEALPAPGGGHSSISRAQAETPRDRARGAHRHPVRDVDAVFDLKHMVITNLVTDKALLNRVFQEAGRKEFRFIARSGIWLSGADRPAAIGAVAAVPRAAHHARVRPHRRLVDRLARIEDDLQSETADPHPRDHRPGPVPPAPPQRGRGRVRCADRGRDHHAAQGDRGDPARADVRPRGRDDQASHVEGALDRSTGLAKPLVVLTIGTPTATSGSSGRSPRR